MIAPRPEPGRAPSVTIPLRYLSAAAAAFVLAALGIPWLAPELAGHYYHPRLLALTHTVTLGWITLTIMGASYQIIPMVLERPVWSERLARWQFVILVLGVSGMVGHFAIGQWAGLVWAAGLVGLGVVAHVANAVLSVRGLRRWTFTARLVAGALAGLAATAAFGVGLGVDRLSKFLPGEFFPALHAHFHLALLGWVAPMVIGVAARVYPMFLLAREPDGWPGLLQLGGLGLGVPAMVAGLLFTAPALEAAGALAVAAAAIGHGLWVIGIVRTRKRPALDWGLRFVLTGTAFLVPVAAMGIGFAFDVLAGPRLGLAYGILALGGWVSLTIAGMMLKIVPFLVWYRVYGPRVGRAAVPALAHLSWPRAEGAAFVLLTGGTFALAGAVGFGDPALIRVSGLLLAAGALAFAAALGRVLVHLGAPGRGQERPAAERVLVQ